MDYEHEVQIPEPKLSRFLFADTRIAWFWLAVRLYVGYVWIHAGWEKFGNSAWTGDQAGLAVTGFVNGALTKTVGLHPDVQGWYAQFLQNVVLPNSELFSYIITYGEIVVGVALVLGLFTGIASFFGLFMNYNFLLAGTVSINPILVILQLLLMLAWRVAGWWGIDRYLLPYLGVPWQASRENK